jgi:hypothetical protein
MTQRTGANREMDERTDEGTLIITGHCYALSVRCRGIQYTKGR